MTKPIKLLIMLGFLLVCYFGFYFAAAKYVDIGDSTPIYILEYRLGSRSLHGWATFFEPARRIDQLLFRPGTHFIGPI